MESQVQQIANKYLQNVRPTGENNLRATCPLCESSRAFIISQDTGLWICFSCSAKGAIVQLLYKLGFTRKQVDRLVQKTDFIPPLPDYVRKKKSMEETWAVLPEYVLSSYDECPKKLLDAGFDMDLLQDQDVGFDRIENRITFAIRDYRGRLVGVSGRAHYEGQYPRYLVYDKVFDPIIPGYKALNRKHLYGFHEVYADRYFSPDQENTPIILVEGYKGCLWLKQLGFSHTVALQGSSLTRDQQRMLERVRGPKYILLDHEEGKSISVQGKPCAAVSIAKRLAKTGQAFICQYPTGTKEGTSPDDLSFEEAELIIHNAKTIGQLKAHQYNSQTHWRRR